jgi:hypothetical protein
MVWRCDIKTVADMTLLLLEALGALLIFVFIVWWTMFSGRKGGEPVTQDDTPEQDASDTGTAHAQSPTPDADDPHATPKHKA